MINFPVLCELKVGGFGLYPGSDGQSHLQIDLKPGLTLVVGANGLGKTTLVTIIYRLLTGPFDIPALSTLKDLGNAKLQATELTATKKRVFATRVFDGAKGATATLTLRLDHDSLEIERSLSDLSLVRFAINGTDLGQDEIGFQKNILERVGVWAFGDWILLLRHIVFYFEDRRALVWDVSAQRQMLRLLFLSQKNSQVWSENERKILEKDSRMRNLRFALNREERALSDVETKTTGAAATVEELKTLELLQKVDIEKRDGFDNEISELDAARKHASLRLLTSRQERENKYRAYENAKLKAVESRFPNKSDSARYIYEHLFAEEECLVCGNHAALASKEFKKRISATKCIVCSTDLSNQTKEILSTELADKRLSKTLIELRKIEPELEQAIEEESQAEKSFVQLVSSLTKIDATISARSSKMDTLIRKLPPAETELHSQRQDLSSMRGRLERLIADLTEMREEFAHFVSAENQKLAKAAETISKQFQKYAQGFLLETIRLIWSPQSYKLGESGDPIEFPAFELDMSGASFATSVRRSGPEQVSESQREFIDLAFRMALIHVSSNQGPASLVIDAPESSLDAVFVSRAADVLAQFSNAVSENRLIITSNLVEGDLLPKLLLAAGDSETPLNRLVNLFEIAEPTAAVRELGAEYKTLFEALKQRTTKLASVVD